VDVVVDSASEGVTEGGNLLHEDVNDPLEIGEFTISSVGFLVVESFFGGKIVLGVNNILVRLSGKGPSSSFSDKSDLKIDGEFFKISLSFDNVSFKSSNLSLGFDLELGGIEGGLDLVRFKESSTFFKMSLESVKHSVNFVVEGTNEIGSVNSGLESLGVKLFSVGIFVTRFFSSR
jgi:hypothetical protein